MLVGSVVVVIVSDVVVVGLVFGFFVTTFSFVVASVLDVVAVGLVVRFFGTTFSFVVVA